MKRLYYILLFATLIGCKKSEDGTVEVVPIAPNELKAAVVSKDQIDLTWKDNSTNETGYKIERKTESGVFTETGSTATDITTFSDKTVSLNTNYTYRVYSFNQVGKSISYSNEVTIKTINIPTITTNSSIAEITTNSAKSGGNIISDGGSSIISRGIVWGISSNPTITLSTKTIDGTGLGAFQSTIVGLTLGTKYYVRSYATNNAGTAYGNEVSFTTNTFSTVTGANGRIWMDRNLGASRVATSGTDEASYGDLYQWGRGTDGHQFRTSAAITNWFLSNKDIPGNSLFINPNVTNTSYNDWRSPQNNNLWQGVNGINNPCPSGFRLPTESEWNTEIISWGSQNNVAIAFESVLKLTFAGSRNLDGLLRDEGKRGQYWSSTVSGTNVHNMIIGREGVAGTKVDVRAAGFSCRCIKD